MKKSYKILIFSLCTVIAGGIMFTKCATFGSKPKGKIQQKIKESAQFNPEKKKFENRRPELIAKMKKESMSWKTMKKWFSNTNERTPANRLPQIKPDIAQFIKNSDHPKVIWLGHSTILLNLAGKIILIDPVFSNQASPVSFMVKRFQKPVLSLQELPEIDHIIISHDHYDHLDMETVQFFRNKRTTFMVPLGIGAHLSGWGIDQIKIDELDWWESLKTDAIEFISTPAQHFSGRSLTGGDKTLWSSWVIRNTEHQIFYSGDSGYDAHFKEIGDKYGPFDVAFIENGQYNHAWKAVHMMPEESAQAYFDLKAELYIPVHWGMFNLSLHNWYDPIEEIHILSQKQGLRLATPQIGELLEITEETQTKQWWRKNQDKQTLAQAVPIQQ